MKLGEDTTKLLDLSHGERGTWEEEATNVGRAGIKGETATMKEATENASVAGDTCDVRTMTCSAHHQEVLEKI